MAIWWACHELFWLDDGHLDRSVAFSWSLSTCPSQLYSLATLSSCWRVVLDLAPNQGFWQPTPEACAESF